MQFREFIIREGLWGSKGTFPVKTRKPSDGQQSQQAGGGTPGATPTAAPTAGGAPMMMRKKMEKS